MPSSFEVTYILLSPPVIYNNILTSILDMSPKFLIFALLKGDLI